MAAVISSFPTSSLWWSTVGCNPNVLQPKSSAKCWLHFRVEFDSEHNRVSKSKLSSLAVCLAVSKPSELPTWTAFLVPYVHSGCCIDRQMPLKHNHGFHCIYTPQSMCVRKLVGRNLFQDAEISRFQADGVSWVRLTHLISGGQLISRVNKGLIHLQIATRHLPSLFLLARSFSYFSLFSQMEK